MLATVSSPYYSYQFPTAHRFPMQKFRLLYDYLCNSQHIQAQACLRPGQARKDVLELAHCPAYIKDFVSGELSQKALRRLGLPWSQGLVNRTLISPNGTLLTAHLALRDGIACHLAGGTHHAHYNFGSGYCVLNDLAITALSLLKTGKAQRVLIFDCDVHQGDGTAAILADEANAYTCSIHCEKNFPARKQQSDLDIDLPKGLSDEAYLQQVADALDTALAQSQADLVLYDAGVDVYKDDPLGLLDVSLAGIRERDRYVLTTLRERQIPIATVIGGGYDRDQAALALRHAIVVEEAAKLV